MLGLVLSLLSVADAQVPNRVIPPGVLVEVELLTNDFELALALDCSPTRCFSKGCTYLDHAVADRARSTSLPGLGQDAGPGSLAPQEYLTKARCSYAHEEALDTADVQSLNRRLQAKLSSGWTVVSVSNQALQPLPEYLRDAPDTEPVVLDQEPEEVVVAEPEPWSLAAAGRELWAALLPHFYWMIGLGLVTLSAWLLIWGWRRLGRMSPEEQALLAQLAEPDQDEPEPAPVAPVVVVDSDADWVADQDIAWSERLDAGHTPQTEALVRLLLTEQKPMLAKAVLRFPSFADGFPTGADVAASKLEFADYLKSVDETTLPSDAAFFEALNRQALSAALASQSDAAVLRSLREDFGAAGLTRLIGTLPARAGALLFAMAPPGEQLEMARLLSPLQAARGAEQLLQTNRMDRNETTWLFALLEASRADLPLPAPPPAMAVSDRGAVFDAAGAVSTLLGRVSTEQRAALFEGALASFNGTFPSWYGGILVPELLFALSDEARADLLLEVDVTPMAAWMSLLDGDVRKRLLATMPVSLRSTVSASSSFSSRGQQLALAQQGRRALARGFQRQLARAGLAFEQVATG